MPFGRKKNLMPDTDVFPLTDTLMDFDDTLPVAQRKSRRQNDPAKTLPKWLMAQKWLRAAGLIGLYLLGILVFWQLGMVQRSTVLVLLGLIGFFLALFFVAFQAKWHLQFAEKRLKLPIVSCAIASMLVICYLDPASHILFIPFTFIAIAYGMYRISRRSALIVAGLILLAFAFIIWVHYRNWHNPALLKLEFMHLVTLALALPAFISQTGKVQFLHRVLHRASKKIKNIQEDAQRDNLLGCFNRRYTVAALEQQKQLADENGTPLCLAVLDIDHFKKVNDELGHLGGDEVLRTFSRLAQEHIRAGDVFGRYGGEEFLLVFPATSLLPALNTCERIRSQIESHHWDNVSQRRVSVSIGVTQYIPGESVLELFSRTDTAMYLAKEGGRNQVVVEEPVTGADKAAP
ncbi:GGDEF domain-containing protein [Undibacterium sp. Jales W-56]|uniref:GGDEF domain-containing protein n=1 Tax=Undibacterium sp. Jales W-56 TaxID=2897325 RepID=UPI0021D14063|nr:GGDEF domain-containing protein [Undibacterium sp. Jales W-56]MCU6432283.1 GGDEF domain-containing protein [Undibacterium sp. Jales W-56]